MKWVDLDIPPAGKGTGAVRRDPLLPVLRELQSRPGKWAELDRYPMSRIGSARSRGSNIVKRHAGVEYAVLPSGNEAVLYLRVSEDV